MKKTNFLIMMFTAIVLLLSYQNCGGSSGVSPLDLLNGNQENASNNIFLSLDTGLTTKPVPATKALDIVGRCSAGANYNHWISWQISGRNGFLQDSLSDTSIRCLNGMFNFRIDLNNGFDYSDLNELKLTLNTEAGEAYQTAHYFSAGEIITGEVNRVCSNRSIGTSASSCTLSDVLEPTATGFGGMAIKLTIQVGNYNATNPILPHHIFQITDKNSNVFFSSIARATTKEIRYTNYGMYSMGILSQSGAIEYLKPGQSIGLEMDFTRVAPTNPTMGATNWTLCNGTCNGTNAITGGSTLHQALQLHGFGKDGVYFKYGINASGQDISAVGWQIQNISIKLCKHNLENKSCRF